MPSSRRLFKNSVSGRLAVADSRLNFRILLSSDGSITIDCGCAEVQAAIEIALEQKSAKEMQASLLDTIAGILKDSNG